MKKFIITSVLLSSLTTFAYEPLQVTKANLKELHQLDADIYSLSTLKKDYNFEEVANYIYKNLAYKVDYTELKINLGVTARTSALQNGSSYDKDRIAGTITATYPIFDAQEANAKEKQIIVVKQSIISKAQDYFLLKAQLHDFKVQKEILLSIETRAKARKLTAVGSFDDWAKIMDNIRTLNMNIIKTELSLSEYKQLLLSYVHQEAKKKLEQML